MPSAAAGAAKTMVTASDGSMRAPGSAQLRHDGARALPAFRAADGELEGYARFLYLERGVLERQSDEVGHLDLGLLGAAGHDEGELGRSRQVDVRRGRLLEYGARGTLVVDVHRRLAHGDELAGRAEDGLQVDLHLVDGLADVVADLVLGGAPGYDQRYPPAGLDDGAGRRILLEYPAPALGIVREAQRYAGVELLLLQLDEGGGQLQVDDVGHQGLLLAAQGQEKRDEPRQAHEDDERDERQDGGTR